MTWLPRLPAKCSSGEALNLPSSSQGCPLPPFPTPPPRPILRLQGPQATLYVELIQTPSPKGDPPSPALLWVRPLFLQQGSQVWNLQASPDLLWPAARFTPAYAEEVLPLFDQARDPRPGEIPARQRLQEFLQQAWESPCSSS